MARNLALSHAESDQLVFVNSTGADILSGAVVRLAGGQQFGVANADIPNGGTGVLTVAGTFRLTKPTGAGTDYAQGTLLGWDSTNNRVTTDLSQGAIIRVRATPATAATLVEGVLNAADRVRIDDFITATNGSGSTWTAGVPVFVGGQWAVPLADIANTATGTLRVRGRVTIAKTAGFAVTVGQPLGLVTGAAVAGLTNGAVIRATAAAASADVLVTGDLNPTPRVSRGRVLGNDSRVAANVFTNPLGFTPVFFDGYVTDAAGAIKAGLTRAITGNSIAIGATAIAASDIVGWNAVEF